MPILVGRDVSGWLSSAAAGERRWLHSGPAWGRAYPVAFDVADSARAAGAGGVVDRACAALAWTWEELTALGDPAGPGTAPRSDDVLEQDSDAQERYLASALARALGQAGEGLGVVLRQPQRYDHGSAFFARQLLREAAGGPLTVVVEAPPTVRRAPTYADLIASAEAIDRARPRGVEAAASERAAAVAALCPQGAPAAVVEAVCGQRVPPALTLPGPAGVPWAHVPGALRARSLRTLPRAERRRLHLALFDAWPPGGLGYLRRAHHAIVTRDARRLREQHAVYLRGVSPIGRDFLYLHLAAMARVTNAPQLAPHAFGVLVSAARLASRVRTSGGHRAAVWYYRRALRATSDPTLVATVLYEVANTYAVQRHPAALEEARRWYARADDDLIDSIADPGERARAAIRLANGRALVAYHSGDDQEALRLERAALEIAESVEPADAGVSRWGRELVNMNTATLLERRFGRREDALGLLSENMATSDGASHERVALDAARIHFDDRRYDAVVDALAPVYEHGHAALADDEQELFARSLLALSLGATGQRERARRQLPHLRALAYRIESGGAAEVLGRVESLCGEADNIQVRA